MACCSQEDGQCDGEHEKGEANQGRKPHSRSVPSYDPEARSRLSGEKARLTTAVGCPSSIRIKAPLSVSQSWIAVFSYPPPDARMVPSGLYARLSTTLPVSISCNKTPVSTSQMRT